MNFIIQPFLYRIFYNFANFIFANLKKSRKEQKLLASKVSGYTVYSPRGQKIESAQNIHASRGLCKMHVHQFWWVWPLWFWRFCSFFVCLQNGQIFPLDLGLKSMGVKKYNWLKKSMQVEVDVKCMQTNFGECGLFDFENLAPFSFASKWPNFSFELLWGSKNRISSKNLCK